MGWPPDKYKAALDKTIEGLERAVSYGKAQQAYNFPVCTEEETEELESILNRMRTIKNTHLEV